MDESTSLLVSQRAAPHRRPAPWRQRAALAGVAALAMLGIVLFASSRSRAQPPAAPSSDLDLYTVVQTSTYGDGQIGKAIAAWEESVNAAGGVTPFDLTKYINEIENRLEDVISKAAERASNCSCGSSCDQLSTYYRKEIMGYGGGAWDDIKDLTPQVTTLVLGAYSNTDWSETLVCEAHERGTRVLLANPSSDFNIIKYNTTWDNHTYVVDWIVDKVLWTAEHYADGFVMDFESKIEEYYEASAYQFSAMVALTNATLQAVRPGSTVGLALAWSPDCIDERCYDTRGLAFAAGVLYVMGYSVQSQEFNRCLAGGSSFTELKEGLKHYQALGVPGYKLVLGTDWGGEKWECVNYDGVNADLKYCQVALLDKPDGYRGVNCSDAVASSCECFEECWDLKDEAVEGTVRYDAYVKMPYFNYMDNNTLYQVWYEDEASLKDKYRMAKNQGIRGVGPFGFGKLNYTDSAQTEAIWSSFCQFADC